MTLPLQPSTTALVLPDGPSASPATVHRALDWIRAGRPALILGAPIGAETRPAPPPPETLMPRPARWSFDHGDAGPASGTLTDTNGTLHITFSPLRDWSVFTSAGRIRVFAPGADTLTFLARAAAPQTDVQIELRDAKNRRWFASVRLGTTWQRHALYPEDFRHDGIEPTFDQVDVIAFALSGWTPRMKGRPADFELREIGSARDPAPARRLAPPLQDALSPHWKFGEHPAFWTPVPRASGQGAFRGSRWRLIGADQQEWTFLERPVEMPERAFVATGWKDRAKRLSPEALARAANALRRLLEGPTLFAAGARHFAYRPGEPMLVGAEWSVGRSAPDRRVPLALRLETAEGRIVWEETARISASTTNAWATTRPAPAAPGLYRLRTRLASDEIVQELTVLSGRPDAAEDFVTVTNGQFMLHGKPWHPIGVNYVPRYSAGLNPEDYRDAWMNDDYYDPVTVDQDLAHIAAMGGTFVAIQAPALSSTRNLVDFLRLSRKHGLKVNLFVWELNPLGFDVGSFRRRVAETDLAGNATVLAYDVAWEFGFKVFNERARRGATLSRAWAEWVETEYGSVAAAERAWGCAAWRDAQGRVTGPAQKMLIEDGPWLRETADYRRFMDDYTSRCWGRARRLIREIDPNHLISYRQGPTVPHDFTFTGPVRHIDFLAPEGYMVADTDEAEGVIAWVTRYASAASGGKPVLWMEFAHSAWDRIIGRARPEEFARAASYAERFYKAGLKAGAAGMTPWWWPGGFRYTECSDCGMVEPTGEERPLAKMMRRYAAPYAADRAPYKPDVWMTFDRDRHAGGYWRAALREGAAEWRKAASAGHRLGIRLVGEGEDSATCERHLLRAEFDVLEVVRTPNGARVRVQAGNPGLVTWLPACAGRGGVSLVVRNEKGEILSTLPLPKRVPRFGDSGLLEHEIALPSTSTSKLVFRLEAESVGAFGERASRAF